jgi:hypothetical protein
MFTDTHCTKYISLYIIEVETGIPLYCTTLSILIKYLTAESGEKRNNHR